MHKIPIKLYLKKVFKKEKIENLQSLKLEKIAFLQYTQNKYVKKILSEEVFFVLF